MKRELGESSSREKNRKTKFIRRGKSEEEEKDDYETSEYKVITTKFLQLSHCCSFQSLPPPETSSEFELKNLLLRFSCNCSSSNDVHLYHINNSNSNINTHTVLTPICTIPASSRIGRSSASALFGSKLFLFGGSPDNETFEQILKGGSDVFSIDFNTTQNQQVVWQKEKFSMLGNRCQPVAIFTHGKIFIFGSNECKTLPKPWAEVFDPNLKTFSPLPEPPLSVKQAYGCINITVVANGDTILLCMKDGLFSFNVVTESWGELSRSSLLTQGNWTSFRSATLDNVLFTYSEGRVHAYDLIGEKWYKKPVIDLVREKWSNISHSDLIQGQVVRTGNKTLCVVWLDELNWQPQQSVGCVNFQVVKESDSNGKPFLRAQLHSRSEYLIPKGYYFEDCLPL